MRAPRRARVRYLVYVSMFFSGRGVRPQADRGLGPKRHGAPAAADSGSGDGAGGSGGGGGAVPAPARPRGPLPDYVLDHYLAS